MLYLILFGPPGSGKGTQSDFLIEKYQFVHISTGNLFRAEIEQKTELGLLAQSYMDKGVLVPDEVTIGMFRNKLNQHPNAKGFIFDGFPRTVAQSESLDALLSEQNTDGALLLIELEVPKNQLVERLLGRGTTSNRPDDQDLAIIEKRFNEYQNNTVAVFDFYHKTGKTRKVDGTGTLEEVFVRICNEITAVTI